MKKIAALTALATGLFLVACSDGSSLPEPTGKASISAVNAISGSPSINFLIEERQLTSIPYKGVSTAASYDDLDYTFNFEVAYAGDTEFTRIGSQHIDFVAGRHYTLLASGLITAPTLTLWESAVRDFDAAATVFQARFAHTSEAWSNTDIDVYFALDGVAPVQGQQVATLAFGEISDPVDFESDAYVITITVAGNVGSVLYQSRPANLIAQTDLIVSPFDGDENDTAPVVVRALNTLGGAATLTDPAFPSTVQFLNASRELGNTDVYDDPALAAPILSGHDFKQVTTSTPIVAGDYNYLYTQANDTSAVLLDTNFSATDGVHYRIVALGSGGTYSTNNIAMNRRSVSTSARLNFFSSTENFDFIDLYIVNTGDSIDGFAPFRSGVISRNANAPYDVAPGDFDLYLTDFATTDIIAGPFSITMAFGDVVDMVVFDTVDPAALEIVVFP